MELRDIQRDVLRGVIPPASSEQIRASEAKLFTYQASPFNGSGRRINRFMLGADPEFMFESGGEPLHATLCGLRPGLAFGSDQNDRLVELRPAPSRSAVEVVASTLSELRWMYRVHIDTRNVVWRAGAFAHGDGIGGHVHFGRKRPQRDEEVAGLDGLARTMRKAALFPNNEWTRRTQGDARRQVYGMYGDIRQQKHGYEYRTLPSWLDNPVLAFLVLTLSKLVVVDPEITNNWKESSPRHPWLLLVGLAKYYKGRDDDAWLLYHAMERPERFAWAGGDFKARWGLSGQPATTPIVYPSVIPATEQDIADVTTHLLSGSPIPMREPEPNFRSTIPAGYRWILPTVVTNRMPGIGEAIYDLVTHRERSHVRFIFEGDANIFSIFYPRRYRGIRELHKFRHLSTPRMRIDCAYGGGDNRFTVYLGRDWRKPPYLDTARKILRSGLLPLWTIDEVTEQSITEWNQTYFRSHREAASLQEILA